MQDNTTDTSRHVATGRDAEEFTISVQEAAEMFAGAGLPRTERAIQRYCKKGELKFVPVDTVYGSKYFISRESIERLIIQKQQAQQFAPQINDTEQSRPVATVRDRSRHDDHDTPDQHQKEQPASEANDSDKGRDTSSDRGERQGATTDDSAQILVKKLQEENLGLKIDVAGKQAFINQLVTERQQLMSTTQELSYKLGAAETRVLQLEAPKRAKVVRTEQNPVEEMTPSTPVGEGSDDAQPASPTISDHPASVVPRPEEVPPKRSLLGRIFGA